MSVDTRSDPEQPRPEAIRGQQDPPVLWHLSPSTFSPKQARNRWYESRLNMGQLGRHCFLLNALGDSLSPSPPLQPHRER